MRCSAGHHIINQDEVVMGVKARDEKVELRLLRERNKAKQRP